MTESKRKNHRIIYVSLDLSLLLIKYALRFKKAPHQNKIVVLISRKKKQCEPGIRGEKS